jgi:hypothetical protein
MEENAYLTSIAASVFYLIAGFRLLRLSRRTRERPELLLGLYFTFSGIFYLGFNLPNLLGFGAWPALLRVAIEWAYILGVFPFLLFIRSVFRSRDAWGGWVVGVCSALAVVGTLMLGLDGSIEYALDSPWFIAQWVGYTAPCVWLCWEATLYRQSAKKRARIGLCPPLVANRYLLLALFGGFQVLACLAYLSLAHEISGNQTVSLITDALIGGTEITSVAVIWLAFFAPDFYSSWITRRAVILPTPMDG